MAACSRCWGSRCWIVSGIFTPTRRCAAVASERFAGLEFFGADHVLFASDAPFGAQGGASYIRETMKVIAALDIAQADKEKICYRNAQTLFKL